MRAVSQMRVVCISDTHNMLHRVRIPDGDVLVHAGDATMGGRTNEVRDFARAFAGLPHRHKLFVAGNHDWLFQTEPLAARSIMRDYGIIYLEDSGITIDGLRFWGSPWQPAFGGWAFNLPRGAVLAEKWKQIPEQLDVLITHGPPYSIGDMVEDCSNTTAEDVYINVGCEALHTAVQWKKPKVHVFGHIHEGYGLYSQEGVTYVNASLCNGQYQPINKPFCLDLSTVA